MRYVMWYIQMTQETQIVRLSKVISKYCNVNLWNHEEVGVASLVVLSGQNEKTDLLCCTQKFISCLFCKMLCAYHHNSVDLFRKGKVNRSRRINTSGLFFLLDTSHVQNIWEELTNRLFQRHLGDKDRCDTRNTLN